MIRCEVCNTRHIVRAKIKKTGKIIAICKECGSVYEVDKEFMPVMGHDPYDVSYFKNLNTLFRTWDELEEIVQYNKKEEDT